MSEHVSIRLPASLGHFAGGIADVTVEARTLEEALEQLMLLHPDLREHILASDGRPRSFVRVFVNSRNVRELDPQVTPLRRGDVVTLVPAIAGG